MTPEQPPGDPVDLARALEAVDQAVIITAPDGTIRFWNRAAEALYGWSASEVLGRPVLEVTPSELAAAEAEAVMERLGAGERWTGEMVLQRRDGTTFLASVTDTPIFDDRGRCSGIIGVSQDVTERSRLQAQEASARRQLEAAQARLEFLADAAAAIGEPLELDERLRRLARLGVPRFADASAVYLLDEQGEPVRIALHHRDPEREATLRAIFTRYPTRLDSRVGVVVAIRQGRTAWLPEVTEDLLRLAARSEEHLAQLRAFRPTAGVAVPLIGPDGPFGAVGFVTVEGRTMTPEDVALAEELCARISVSVYNGQLLEARERDRAAQRYQAALLQSVFEASVDGMLAVDPDGKVLAHNHRFLELWGLDPVLVSEGDDALLDAAAARVADPDRFLDTVRRAYATRVPIVRDELVLADGRILDRYGTRVTDDDGRYLGFTWSFRDVTHERAQQAEVAAVGERFATLARTLQQSLLPPTLPAPDGIELAARYHPAFEGIDVGGDFYDVFAVGDEWVLAIGDVCGKGAMAASLTALARYTLRAAAIHHDDGAATLRELNTAMLAHAPDRAERRFATVCCMRLRATPAGATVGVACGGHPVPLVLRADGAVEPAGVPGTLLGVFDAVTIPTTTTTLHPGDTLVAVTDGVLEARDAAGRLFDTDGLQAVLAGMAGRSAADIAAAIEAAALDVQAGVARDDIAVLVARIP